MFVHEIETSIAEFCFAHNAVERVGTSTRQLENIIQDTQEAVILSVIATKTKIKWEVPNRAFWCSSNDISQGQVCPLLPATNTNSK